MFSEIINNYLEPIGILIGIYLFGHLLTWLIFIIIKKAGKRQASILLQSIRRNLRRPARFLIPLIIAWIGVSLPGFEEGVEAGIAKMIEILVYIGGAWLLVEFTDVISDIIQHQYNIKEADNLEERKIITQMQYVKKVVGVVVVTLTIAFILMQFQKVRELGAGMLTSAGIAGIVLGIAAQRPISNLLAGFQIAFTQPMRIDDVVIAEGEWGRIEEITLTYVVVRIWDQRRLVLPLTYFIEKPFQNWTRTSADILGSVFIYTDYRIPVEALRKHLTQLLEASSLWDGRVNVLQVTDSKENTLEIRALMSAANSSEAWDLRCHIREKLVTFIQENYPSCLPRTRVELSNEEEVPPEKGEAHPTHETEGLSASSETSVDKSAE